MNTIRTLITAITALIVINTASGQSVNVTSVTEQNPPAVDCSPTILVVSGMLSSSNYVFMANNISINGNQIDVDVTYISPFIVTPALAPFSHNVDLGTLAAGIYTVTVNGLLDGIINSTMTYSLAVVPCCGANANFTASDLSVCSGEDIIFTNTSTGQIAQDWYENNVFMANGTNLSLTAGTPGTYVYKLVVTDGTCSDSIEQTVTVYAPPVINSITPSATQLCQGEPFTINSSATGGLAFNWSMDGSGYGSGNNLNSTANGTPGPHTFELVVLNSGCGDTMSTVITFLEAPDAGLIIPSNPNACVGDAVNFSGTATGAVNEDWYSDGVLANTGSTCSITPTTAGTYTISYIVESAAGCLDTAETLLTVAALPVIDLGADTNNCSGPVILNAGSGMASYEWQDMSTGQTFTAVGMGTYTCIVTNADGCVNSDTVFVDSCEGLDEMNELNVVVYPNPSDDMITIIFDGDHKASYEVIDMAGKSLLKSDSNVIDLSGIESGCYFVKVGMNNSTSTIRFIKK